MCGLASFRPPTFSMPWRRAGNSSMFCALPGPPIRRYGRDDLAIRNVARDSRREIGSCPGRAAHLLTSSRSADLFAEVPAHAVRAIRAGVIDPTNRSPGAARLTACTYAEVASKRHGRRRIDVGQHAATRRLVLSPISASPGPRSSHRGDHPPADPPLAAPKRRRAMCPTRPALH